ncbi:MAG TPA: hypothetical protein VGM41_12545 [Chitinophagaceae bacterium]|jgi:hypothetical protein
MTRTEKIALYEKLVATCPDVERKQYGIVQKEYVVVPAGLLQKTGELKPWFELSYNYIKTLKPKPATKSKKKK